MEDCYVRVKSNLVEAKFLGVFQQSDVVDASPLRGGHSGGVVAYPVAVVKMNGKLLKVSISNVVFEILD